MEMTVGSDGATKEIKGLVYYDTLTELEKAGHTCVAVLYQIRNCCVRTGRSVEIGHMMEVTKDVSKIGRSYALTMDVRGWTTYRPFYRSATATGSNPGWTRLMDNGTVLTKRSELLYQGLIEGKGEQANAPVSHPLTSAKNSTIHWDIGTPTISRITNNYQKTQYSNGYEVGGRHVPVRQHGAACYPERHGRDQNDRCSRGQYPPDRLPAGRRPAHRYRAGHPQGHDAEQRKGKPGSV